MPVNGQLNDHYWTIYFQAVYGESGSHILSMEFSRARLSVALLSGLSDAATAH